MKRRIGGFGYYRLTRNEGNKWKEIDRSQVSVGITVTSLKGYLQSRMASNEISKTYVNTAVIVLNHQEASRLVNVGVISQVLLWMNNNRVTDFASLKEAFGRGAFGTSQLAPYLEPLMNRQLASAKSGNKPVNENNLRIRLTHMMLRYIFFVVNAYVEHNGIPLPEVAYERPTPGEEGEIEEGEVEPIEEDEMEIPFEEEPFEYDEPDIPLDEEELQTIESLASLNVESTPVPGGVADMGIFSP